MAQPGPSMQDLIRQRTRAGFVGRSAERALFRANFATALHDERHRFRFHVHGNAGVGKTFLVRELEQIAREQGALTAYVDDSAGSVPEVMAEISRQFAAQGHRLKELNRLLAAHEERRHEAALAALATLDGQAADTGPSTGGRAVARGGMIALGMVPVVGPLAGMLDAEQFAGGVDRFRESVMARFRNHEDVQLVFAPEQVLTPVLLRELADAAASAPWIALFLDTYERTAPYLDHWLHETMTTDRHGAVPATLVVVTAGQRPLGATRWGGVRDFVAEVPLAPFTEDEARGLLAGKGVTAEPVVEEVLRLSGGLPVLVSTLAESRPTDADDVGDPSATAVDRFLKWEQDPARRAAALSCALPRWLDGDVFRAAADCPEEELASLYTWLRGMPFVVERGGGRLRYHDVVRAPMLRAERRRSPREWAGRQRRLARTFREWREETGRGLEDLWADDTWRDLRQAEAYHLLCAGDRDALPQALRDFVHACGAGEVMAVRWARVLVDAGQDADAEPVAEWGRKLTTALDTESIAAALALLLSHAALDAPDQARARVIRGDELRGAGAYTDALAEYDRAVALDPDLAVAYRYRAGIRGDLGDHDAAIADLDRAVALEPNHAGYVALRGEHHRIARHDTEALRDLTEAIRLDPANDFAWASRGATHERRGDLDAALSDLGRSLDLKPDYAWALARRARVWRSLGDSARQLADLDRALALTPDWPWARCERGDALRTAGRDEEAVADLTHALALDPAYTSAYASRGASLAHLGRHTEALADLNRAVELRPTYVWALCRRAALHATMDQHQQARADVEHVRDLDPGALQRLPDPDRAVLGPFLTG
ncbi:MULTISPECIES: tetratricopeptide repeat protein [Streptomyces]|uniref:Tetratricopeptide repeat protein n=1 Tax=Streptomyces koelreuteriae TaxID=2838015 RepID=A0ABX8FUU4_9ACTN|nr:MULTISPECIES: tetratricopeptide repeat protein [Streptomyces]QWB24973.1 tetratricopeptide repeat protein [Streptomyces koelreuteriae]UUA07995.1 tetratricopeptide repeat protein [Streptomyces koelreuteriae]UUA15624.1 tetratricopeptide repeat protein [Streptomyces sp. CRCS-T-1]